MSKPSSFTIELQEPPADQGRSRLCGEWVGRIDGMDIYAAPTIQGNRRVIDVLRAKVSNLHREICDVVLDVGAVMDEENLPREGRYLVLGIRHDA